MLYRLLLLLLSMVSAGASTTRPDADLCRAAIAATERVTGIPDRLMQAVAVVESGRRDPSGIVASWPWTLNVEGVGEVYETKQEAIAAVNRHRAAGARSIDVGCMQVNLMHHADAFPTLEDAFDPAANAAYAARFLQQLLAHTGSWPRAVAGYHSLTPDIGAEYARKVLAIWALPEATRRAPPPAPAPLTVAASPPPSLPAPGGGHIIPAHGSQSPAMTGRTLDSYRAIPNAAGGIARY